MDSVKRMLYQLNDFIVSANQIVKLSKEIFSEENISSEKLDELIDLTSKSALDYNKLQNMAKVVDTLSDDNPGTYEYTDKLVALADSKLLKSTLSIPDFNPFSKEVDINNCNDEELASFYSEIRKKDLDDTTRAMFIYYGAVQNDYVFWTQPCATLISQDFTSYSSLTYYFNICKPNKALERHKLFVAPNKGIINRSNKKNAFLDLLNIPTEKLFPYDYDDSEELDDKHIEILDEIVAKTKRFFDEYGFFVNTGGAKKTTCSLHAVFDIINRFKCTVSLKASISPDYPESKRDYAQMLEQILYLLISPSVNIYSENGILYSTKQMSDFNNMLEYMAEKYGFDLSSFTYNPDSPDYRYLVNVFANNDTSLISLFQKADVEYKRNMPLGMFSIMTFLANLRESRLSFYSFSNAFHKNNNLKILGKAPIKKEALLLDAKYILEQEINYHLSNIKINYNTATNQPMLIIDNLIDVLYLYIAQSGEYKSVLNTCKNCGKKFITTMGRQDKKYCSDKCGNNYRQRKHKIQ